MDLGKGDIVICIDANPPVGWIGFWEFPLVQGRRYTVEQLFPASWECDDPCVRVEEVRLQHPQQPGVFLGFGLHHFTKAGDKGMFDHLLQVDPQRDDITTPIREIEPA